MAPARAFITFVILIMLLAGCIVGGCQTAQPSPARDLHAARRASHRYDFTAIHMGSKARITLYAADETTAADHAAACFDRLETLDAIMSDYRRDSELMQLCEAAGGGPVPVSPALFTVLALSKQMWIDSDGAFDITIGPAVRLWREARQRGVLPESAALNDAMSRVGMRHVQLDAIAQTVHLQQPDMQLDLGGIGKGFALDQLAQMLESRGVMQYMLDLGGDLRIGAAPPGSDGWTIALPPDSSRHDADRQFRVVEITNVGIATSGDAEQHVIIDGQRYSHIIDPRSGLGLTTTIEVTVMADSAAMADALASAVSVLGVESGLDLIERTDGAACRIVVVDPDGSPRVHTSRNWPGH